MKSSPFSTITTSYSSKPYFATNQNSQDFTSTRPNSESFYDQNSIKSHSISSKSSSTSFTPVPLGQHNFNIPAPTETITNSNGFKKRTLITQDPRMDHPFRYGTSPVDNCLAQVESPQMTANMQEAANSALRLSKNIVASTIQAVDNAQLVVGGRNIQVELELSGLKLYDLEQKLDSCLSSSRDMLNLTSKVSPKVSEIIRLSDKKREISPIRPELDLGQQKITPFTVETKGMTSSVSKDEKERIQKLENERNNLKAIIKDATSKVSVGQKSSDKENMNMATTTPTKRPDLTLNKPKSLGRSIERLNENSSPLHPAKTTYNDSPLSRPAQTIQVESPYGLTKNGLFKEYQGKEETMKVKQSTLGYLDIEEPSEAEVVSPNFKSSCEGSSSKMKADSNEVLNIYENRFDFSKKSVETIENADLNVYQPKTEKKSLTRTSNTEWSFNTGHDSSDEEEHEHKEIITPTLPGVTVAKVKPLPSLEKLSAEQKKNPYLLELQIPPDSDQLRGNNSTLKELENVELGSTGNNNQAIKQEILGFLKNFQRGETRESAKQWLKSLIDTENLSKASSPTSRTEREKYENEGESLLKTLINQTQSSLLKQAAKQNSHRSTEGSTSVSLKYTADNSANDFEIPSHREIKSNITSSKVSPRRNQTPRQEQNSAENKPIKKVPALVSKTQGELKNVVQSTGGKRLAPRISPRGDSNTQNVRPPTLSRAGGQQQAAQAQGGKSSFAQDLGHLESLRKTVERSIHYIDKSLEDFSGNKSAVQEASPKALVTSKVPNSFINKTIQNTILFKDEKSQYTEESIDETQRRCQTEGSGMRALAAKEKEKMINTKYFVLTKNKSRNPAPVNMNNTGKSGSVRKW